MVYITESLGIEESLTGFRGRMSKIALFDPLFELQRKKQSDQQGNSLDMMELGMLTLLFFFEQKLIRNHRAGARDLAQYLHTVTHARYQLNLNQYEECSRSIIQVFRPASGRKRAFTFYNWERGEQEVIHTSILRASAYDSETNTQYYALDEDGLELVFATKEFYVEFQLSIHQLVLRKQLEKGEFLGALRQINEMQVDVETLEERMVKLTHEIKRSIVSEDTLLKYGSLLDDIYGRLQRENEEIEELRDFVKETRARIYSDTLQDKQHQAYAYILRIGSELEKVHGRHTSLLERSMQLKSSALHAAKESLYLTGMNSFNFDQDLVSVIVGSPLPLEALRAVLSPFFKLEQEKKWSLFTVFGEQNLTGDDGEDKADQGLLEEIALSEEPDEFTLQRGQLFSGFMADLLDLMEGREEILLSTVIERYRDDDTRQHWLARRVFYDFWIILHHRSPITSFITEGERANQANGMEAALQQIGDRELVLTEQSSVIRINDRYAIQEMTIKWGLGK
ncbi:replicative DNA helicase [Paenibacillus sp. FSL K6-1318]|uniref:replicative DNA helicase n=1 Tax=Paenibacillus sp. FSL K6-1318 TaxID=2975291 RepID=UPI0030EC9032